MGMRGKHIGKRAQYRQAFGTMIAVRRVSVSRRQEVFILRSKAPRQVLADFT
jgi:hypothetical protein